MLTRAPEPGEIVTVSIDTDSHLSVSQTTLMFGDGHLSWNAPQIITVTGIADGVVEGFHFTTIEKSVSSTGGTVFEGVSNVEVEIADADAPSVVITQTSQRDGY